MTLNHFKKSEFTCKCGCKQNLINVEMLEMLDKARAMAKIPFVVTSGYRCPKHPESIKNPTSSHIKGLAVDIKCTDSKSRAIILDSLAYVGFERFGLHDSFIHTDIDKGKASPVIWLY